ncbi:ribonuclease E inhibitor RraB [uncultured Gimesia sp.]|uniref:ribonuclease E inhibitor RraB n=1 Tax=uncultured Gimesia sp. TaxID=1678688 RepID=UPI0030D9DCBF|tara:strand:- start:10483 stop:11223 length:741 start_codon:yes stop_codon:yes gene_type:complete
MSEEPNLSFDIDALFDHMVNNLGHDLADELDWSFSLRSGNLDTLEEVAKEFEQEYLVQLYKSVEETDVDGNSSSGDPMLCIIRRAALTADEVRSLADRLGTIAAERGLVYEGTNCYEPINEEEFFGWLSPDDACWQLQQATDAGLEDNAELPWAFFVLVPDLEGMQKIAAELSTIGLNDRDDFDEPDEDDAFAVCTFVAGRNNEFELREMSTKITQVAESHGGRLEGIQFYTRDEVYEVFGDESDE